MVEASSKSILFVGNYLSKDEIYTSYTQVLAQRLDDRGWRVALTSHVRPKILRLLDMLKTIYQQRELYKLTHIDVFSGQAFIWAYLCGRLLQKLNKPFILSLRGGDLPAYSEKHAWLTSGLLSGAAAVISPSAFLAERLSKFHSSIQVIPNGIDISQYPPKIRQEPEPRLIWLRSFRHLYNPSLAPKALSLLAEHGYNAKLTMVGPDYGEGSLDLTMDLAEKLGVIDKINIVKGVPKNQVPYELAKGDIFINTTNIDNTPVSVIEAMACGLCIVSTNVGGIPYLLEDGVDALLVPPDDPAAMADAIIRIINDPSLSAKLSYNARKKAEQFDWKRIIPMWEQILKFL